MNRPDKPRHKLSKTEIELGGIPNSSEDVKQCHAAAIESYIEKYVGLDTGGVYREADEMGDEKDKPKDDEYSRSKTQQQGPSGSGRPSPQMMKELMEKYKQDPSSVPEHMHAHFEKVIKEEEDKE